MVFDQFDWMNQERPESDRACLVWAPHLRANQQRFDNNLNHIISIKPELFPVRGLFNGHGQDSEEPSNPEILNLIVKDKNW